MITYSLPESLEIAGTAYPIRWDMTAALDIITGLKDPDLTDHDKAELILGILYVDKIPRHLQKEALEKARWFLDGGSTTKPGKGPQLVDWEQDYNIIIPAVNRVVGYDIRQDPTTIHWWTFLGAYMEIGGECLFAQVVSIRDKEARGKKLEKYEKEWATRNRNIIDIKKRYSEQEKDFLHEQFGIS